MSWGSVLLLHVRCLIIYVHAKILIREHPSAGVRWSRNASDEGGGSVDCDEIHRNLRFIRMVRTPEMARGCVSLRLRFRRCVSTGIGNNGCIPGVCVCVCFKCHLRGGRKVRRGSDLASDCVYELVTGHEEQLTGEVHRR